MFHVRSAKPEIIVFLLCICRLLTETAKQAQGPWGGSGEWTEVEVFSNLVFAQYLIWILVSFIFSKWSTDFDVNISNTRWKIFASTLEVPSKLPDKRFWWLGSCI